MAKVAGYVKRIYVDVGDRVKAGQLLATLEVPEMADELTRAGATIKRSTAEVAHARDEVHRAESAHDMLHLSYTRLASVSEAKPGLVAQQEIDDAHSRDLVSEAQVEAAKSNLSAAQEAVNVSKADQAKVKTLIEYTRVLAPFTGVVTRRFADNGSMIQAGTASQTQAMPIVRLAQNDLLRLILPVPESAVPKVHLGQRLEVSVPSLGREFHGKVARFADEVDRSTRTMLTEVDVPNANYLLVPGMYAEVKLDLDRRPSALTIPLSAVDLTERPAKVLVVSPRGAIEVREVQLGLEVVDVAEVRSGLSEDEMVVTGNRNGLRPGQQVTPKVMPPVDVVENK